MAFTFTTDKDPVSIFLGFDEVSSLLTSLDAVLKEKTDTVDFPLYNMFNLDEKNMVIELHVTGFRSKDIEISMKGCVLTITGKREVPYASATKVFGNAAFPDTFKKSFVLSNSINLNEIGYEDRSFTYIFRKNINKQRKRRTISYCL